MRLVILGPPGAGKGTQAELLSEALGIPHISTGDLFRANISQGTAVGVEAKKYLDAGNLVPSEITVDMVRARVGEPDAAKGFILDGFPRSTEQADALKEILASLDSSLDAVLSFEVDTDVVVDRMLARGRADDTEEVIRNRMAVYTKETAPLLAYYGDQVKTIDAVGDIQDVHQRVLSALGAGVS
ncbi:adenylate kinase [Gordonia bronchialis DSM 43247]|uniref:Adenylate kinase n=1 Tax=Gordonia bronchialis (strain ATCC 25592 / DSM 43247 / BCRC 13721 / JCM 3198 / KCTC 3076 / NBRC 16047 / NCTC 10667) TaxID=526226 RepID=D0L2G6_GORB4|nr:adenylate kinase [Gordonia bronchialis]ACY22869.1 adenylate kinase [Gordonia bronchialis DSM 43247]MCC3325648.1 adenylate kinase [Gordonia bronchialis]QGS23691.1 adenylate kinase [Gordonia bronchialis]UAK40135.1 adenylate kinase [Gordonia bronchialis]STQ65816.1 Adenylate kinase [Gordonia bronchialis]